MPPELPQISGRQLVKLLVKLGYEIVRQRGSHMRLRKQMETSEHKVTVPLHRTVAKGTLRDILDDVAKRNDMTTDEIIRL